MHDPRDAGAVLDAGEVGDGGDALDAGFIDAGFDAGVIDAGPIDAGQDGGRDAGGASDAGDAGKGVDAGSASDAGHEADGGALSDLVVVPNFYNTSTTDVQNGYVDEDFKLFWYAPVRAYPELALRHQFIVYEAFNQPLTWAITSAPVTVNPMTLSADGVFSWVPAQSESGRSFPVTVRVSRPVAGSKPAVRFLERTFSVSVDPARFLFVATSGDDHNPGTKALPLRTLRSALAKVATGPGMTIYLRSGPYQEYSCTPSDPSPSCSGVSPLATANTFTADDPLVIGTMPGEPTRFVLDCASKGWGVVLGGAFAVLQDAEVENASVSPTDPFEMNPGAVQVNGTNNVVENVFVHDSNWDPRQNVTGLLVQGARGAVLDRVVSSDNLDKTPGQYANSNSSNYLFYTEPPAKGPIYVLNCSSSGSVNGYKVKHPGVEATVLIHRSRSLHDQAGFQIADDFSSIRYSLAVEDYGHGLVVGPSEASLPGHDHDLLLEHDTVVNNGGGGVYFASTYMPAGVLVLKNIVFQTQQVTFSPYYANNDYPASATSLFGELWVYQADVSHTSPRFSKNVYFAKLPDPHAAFRLSSTSYATLSDWQKLGYDVDSAFADPRFVDLTTFALQPTSPALFTGGEFAGAVR